MDNQARELELDLKPLRDLQETISTALARLHGVARAIDVRQVRLRKLEAEGLDFARPTYLRGYLYRRIPKDGPKGKDRREYVGAPTSPKATAAIEKMERGRLCKAEAAALQDLLKALARAQRSAGAVLDCVASLTP